MLQSGKFTMLCSLLLTLLASACGDEHHYEPPDPAPVVVDAGPHQMLPTPPPPPPPYDDVELVVRNQTTRTIYRLYVSPSTSESWGPDQLRTKTIPPGGAATFYSDYCDANYDLKAVDAAGNTIVRANRIFFACGGRETVTLF